MCGINYCPLALNFKWKILTSTQVKITNRGDVFMDQTDLGLLSIVITFYQFGVVFQGVLIWSYSKIWNHTWGGKPGSPDLHQNSCSLHWDFWQAKSFSGRLKIQILKLLKGRWIGWENSGKRGR